MLKRLHVRNFTVFEDADFEFGPGLNVVVGTNGTGKSHVLKLGYAVEIMMAEHNIKTNQNKRTDTPDNWNFGLVLTEVFQSSGLSELVRRSDNAKNILLDVEYRNTSASVVSFNINAGGGGVNFQRLPSIDDVVTEMPVFIPAKEVLTFFEWLPGIYDKFRIAFDRTYIDLCKRLNVPLLRDNKDNQNIIEQLEKIMRGKIRLENNRFYLYSATGTRLEINMIAEGIRKFGTLAYLLSNGSLTKETTLYWDEPEANLNPALLKQLAALLAELARQGFQTILATHSLFLLKEFHIQAYQHQTPVCYFGLNERLGKGVEVTTADDLELLPNIAALDAEMDLSDRFQDVLDQEDVNDN